MAKPTSPRWRRRKEERPSEIVAAALASFAERGFAATRLEDVAARAGVTRGTLYLYFPSKEELFKAVVRQFIVPVIQDREEMIAAAALPSAQIIEKFIMSFPDLVAGSALPAIPRLVIAEARNFPDLAQFYFDEVLQRARTRVRALIKRGVDRGEFRKVDIDRVFFCLMGPILAGVIWQSVFQPHDDEKLDFRALCRAHLDLLLNGLLPRETA
jgi:AcrR family transcriptional regulator